MKVEKKGSFQFGFVLREKDLRRIIDTIKEQITKVNEKEKIEHNYSAKLKNGAILETSEIEHVLAVDNIGSSSVVRFTFNLKVNDNHSVVIEFLNPKIEGCKDSITYTVSSTNKDWVFVTLSLIEERITFLKRSKVFVPEIGKIEVYMYLFMIGILLFAVIFFYDRTRFQQENIDDDIYRKFNFTERVELKAKQEPDTTPIEVLLFKYKLVDEYSKFFENAKHAHKKKQIDRKIIPSVIEDNIFITICSLLCSGIVLPFIVFIYLRLANNLYPLYIFCWGSTQDIFIKKETQRKFLLVTIITGLIVSVFAGFLVEIL